MEMLNEYHYNPEDAFEAAQSRIRRVGEQRRNSLDLHSLGLIKLPVEIAELTDLERLNLENDSNHVALKCKERLLGVLDAWVSIGTHPTPEACPVRHSIGPKQPPDRTNY